MKKTIVFFTMFLIICSIMPNMTIADTTHERHIQTHMPAMTTKGHTGPTGTFEHTMIEKNIRAEFQIMSLASMNMKDPNGDSHHVMVKLFDDSANYPIKDAVGKVKVIEPNGNEQINSLKNYNGIFAANFSFKKTGKYGVICLVKVGEEKYLFKFWYPHR
ncbi:MAG: hypothetical protein U9N83_04870 [Thermodesulfobacteriota bacterium]|nr:hypothetical protein [Thermodesulfobacteriota bacterium]